MADLGTCPLPELSQHFRDAADKAVKKNDFLTCLLMNTIANRFQLAHDELTELASLLAVRDKEARDRLWRGEEFLGVLRHCKREHVYHSWQAFNGKTEEEVREILNDS